MQEKYPTLKTNRFLLYTMHKIRVREANYSDIQVLYTILSKTDAMHQDAHPEIFRKVKNPDKTKAYYKDCIDDLDALICIAEKRETPVGALICRLQFTPDTPVLIPRKFICIENITVTPSHRRQGIGTALIDFAEEWAKKKEADAIELTVWNFNKTAVDFYNCLAYQPFRCRMKKELR